MTEEIRVLLARRRMSAAELARRTGQKQAALSRRMTGDIPFDLDELEIIARELGVTVSELLAGGGKGGQATVASLAAADLPISGPPKVPDRGASLIPAMRRPARIESVTPQPIGRRESDS